MESEDLVKMGWVGGEGVGGGVMKKEELLNRVDSLFVPSFFLWEVSTFAKTTISKTKK